MKPILEKISSLVAGEDFLLGYSPERIDPGNKEWTFKNTPKIVSGMNETSLKKISEFYNSIIDEVVKSLVQEKQKWLSWLRIHIGK